MAHVKIAAAAAVEKRENAVFVADDMSGRDDDLLLFDITAGGAAQGIRLVPVRFQSLSADGTFAEIRFAVR